MTEARAKALRALAEQRKHLEPIRERAILACALNPLAWLAVHGVPLAEYLAMIDKMDALCAQAEAELEGAG